MYQSKYPIAYDCRREVHERPLKEEDQSVLLLNGFGMGTFHQHRLMDELLTDNSASSSGTVVYAMDYLGQGKSWPIDCADGTAASEFGLQYSGQMWVDQIIAFIENVMVHAHGKVHLVGNSVGGYLATYVAALRPDLVSSVTLINATPVWGLNLPGWSGHLPAPVVPKAVGRFFFDRIRDPVNIKRFLRATYVNPAAYDDSLIQQIRACTLGPGGHAAFASILWSPPVSIAGVDHMYDCLERLQCDVLLLFGREDPWCKPAFAREMLSRLQQRGDRRYTARYLEISPVGHCPNHEAPRATAHILRQWLLHHRREGDGTLVHRPTAFAEAWGETVVQERAVDEISVSWLDRLAVRLL